MEQALAWAALGTGFTFLMTTLGAAAVFLFRGRNSALAQRVFLGFAAGVMIAASVWSLLIPAIERAEDAGQIGWLPAAGGFVIGVAFLMGLHQLIPHLHPGEKHPEGLPSRWERPTLLFTAVTLHNIPEGMAVAVPLIAGGMGRLKAVLLTAASGAPIVLGAWLGLWLGDIGPLGLCCSLGFASGAMLYVVFGEIIPQAVLMYRSKLPAFFVIVGILIGMGLIYL